MALSTLRHSTTIIDFDEGEDSDDGDITIIPIEVMSRVFSYCNVNAIKNVRLVSLDWCEISWTRWSESKNVVLVVICRNLEKCAEAEETIANILSKAEAFGNIRKNSTVIGWCIKPKLSLWKLTEQIGPFLSYLRLDQCEIENGLLLTEIIDKLSNLETLILNEVTFQREVSFEEMHNYYSSEASEFPLTYKLKHMEVVGTWTTPGVHLGWYWYLMKYSNIEFIRMAYVSGNLLRESSVYVLIQHLQLIRKYKYPLKLEHLDIIDDYMLTEMLVEKLIRLELSLTSMKLHLGVNGPNAAQGHYKCHRYWEFVLYGKIVEYEKLNLPEYHGDKNDLTNSFFVPDQPTAFNRLMRQQSATLKILACKTTYVFTTFDYTVFTDLLTKITFIGTVFATPEFLAYTPNLKYLKWHANNDVIAENANEPFMSEILLKHLDYFWFDPPNCVSLSTVQAIHNWCPKITKLLLTLKPDSFQMVCSSFVNLHHLGVMPFSDVCYKDIIQFDEKTQSYTGGILNLTDLRKFIMPNIMTDSRQFDKKIFVEGFLKLKSFRSLETHEDNVNCEVTDPVFQRNLRFRYPPVELVLSDG